MKKWIVPSAAAFIAIFISIVAYDSLPAQMVVNFSDPQNAGSGVDKRIAVSLFPFLILVLSWVVLFLIRIEKDENKRKRTEYMVSAINGISTIVILAAHGFIIAYNLDYHLSFAVFVTFVVGGTFVLIGNLLPRLPQGTYAWPKMEEFRHRHLARFAGRLMVGFGLLFIIVALLPGSYIFPVFFIILGCFIVIMVGKSIQTTIPNNK